MRRRSVAAVLLAGLAFAEPAQAVRVEVTPDAVVYTAAPGEINRVGIGRGRDPGELQVRDSSDVFPGAVSARVEAVPPCRLASETPPTARAAVLHGAPVAVDCPARPSVVVTLGDNGDSMAIEATIATDDLVNAGPGSDSVSTGAGADVLLGGAGRDTLVGGLGPDRMDGGPAADTVRYDGDERRRGIVVGLLDRDANAGSADDGPRGSRDVLAGVENVNGTAFADLLLGDGRPNQLIGDQGADRLGGLGGSDALVGGPERDRIDGGSGSDRLDSRDGAIDRVACGPGDDLLAADLRDRPGEDCDTVGRAREDTFDPPMEIAPRARLTRGGRLLVRVRCTSATTCEGTATAGGGSRPAALAIEPGAAATVAVRVRRRARGFRVVVTTGEEPGAQRTTRRVRVSGAVPAR